MSKPTTVEEYLLTLQEERVEPFVKLRDLFKKKLEPQFKECINYGMVGYVVSKEDYPDGYHCDPKLPLPYINLANQKNFIAVYHMGLYATPELKDWFVTEYAERCKYKLDMGKSCVRLKKMNDIPYDLFDELLDKQTKEDWINIYESSIKR